MNVFFIPLSHQPPQLGNLPSILHPFFPYPPTLQPHPHNSSIFSPYHSLLCPVSTQFIPPSCPFPFTQFPNPSTPLPHLIFSTPTPPYCPLPHPSTPPPCSFPPTYSLTSHPPPQLPYLLPHPFTPPPYSFPPPNFPPHPLPHLTLSTPTAPMLSTLLPLHFPTLFPWWWWTLKWSGHNLHLTTKSLLIEFIITSILVIREK